MLTIGVLANENQWEEIKSTPNDVNWLRVNAVSEFDAHCDAFFILTDVINISLLQTNKPVFINAVVDTLKQLQMPSNFLRINGWNGFLSKKTWEISGNISPAVSNILSAINKSVILVKDEPGFVTARVIAMIINEAYYALSKEVSTKVEIDIAMKLGTNYPFGPFEWADKIGVKKIYMLLQQLAVNDKRYTPSSLLQKEATL